MRLLADLLYSLILLALAPWMVVRSLATGRYRRGLRPKLLGTPLLRTPASGSPDAPRVWFHGVSVGEIQLLVTIVAQFRQRFPDYRPVVSVTTDTGMAEARRRFVDVEIVYFPFDFSWAVSRTLSSVSPTLIVLAESELWPNFLRIAAARKIPVVVVNGRMSPRSAKRYTALARIARPLLLDRVSMFLMQSQGWADNLRQIGVPAERVRVTGSIKYDGAGDDRRTSATVALGRTLGIAPGESVWVAGSTHAPEEKIVLDVFRRVRVRFPDLRLILVPRSPDRFEEVAALAEGMSFSLLRRSRIVGHATARIDPEAVILLDSMGELTAAWGLADVGYVGGTLDGRRGGQSMIEPAGLGVPTAFGPMTWNFRDAVARLLEVSGAFVIRTPEGLEQRILELLEDESLRRRMGEAARGMVRSQQGATARTLDALAGYLERGGAVQTEERRAA